MNERGVLPVRNPASANPTVSPGILGKVLLVRLSRVTESGTEITRLHQRCWQDGRLPVDVASFRR
jgi:hypothetical protein